ncbi:hypothetical protein D3C81_272720 [compost metagenome]
MRRSLSRYRVTKMKIKALWGFRGDALKLKSPSADVKAGDVFPDVEPEYGHALVGKRLVLQVHDGVAPKETKPAQPSEFKAGDGDTSAAAPDAQADAVVDADGAQAASGDATAATPPTAAVDAGADGVADAGGADEKQQLIQQLEAAGATFDRRWGVQRLAEVLADAQKTVKPE